MLRCFNLLGCVLKTSAEHQIDALNLAALARHENREFNDRLVRQFRAAGSEKSLARRWSPLANPGGNFPLGV
jgi:hypothetical protein